MIYEVKTKPENQDAHKDIAHEMEKKKNGLFTIIVRVSSQCIVDVVFMETKVFKENGRKD